MFDLWAPKNSTLREKVLEHIFLSELSKALLLDMRTPFEVLRSEFDANGYDVVIEARGVLRHIQLKATRIGGKRRHIDVNLALVDKPGGCVVWMMADEATLAIGPFLWLGGKPGESLPAPDGPVTRHSRANAAGVKGERKGLRQVPIRHFARLETIKEVAEAMFGVDHDKLLHDHLASRGVRLAALSVPDDLAWRNSVEFAHLIDGYELADAANLGEPMCYLATSRAAAEQAGAWVGSALELWVALFLEHRRDHFSGAIGLPLAPDQPAVLDDLCQSLLRSLRGWT